MTGLIDRLRFAAERRASYRRTLAELRRTPMDVRLDLNIYSGDFPLIAKRAAGL